MLINIQFRTVSLYHCIIKYGLKTLHDISDFSHFKSIVNDTKFHGVKLKQ